MYKEALKLLKDIDPKLYVEKYLTGSYVITKKTVYKDIDFVLYTYNVKALEDELKLFGFDLCGEDMQWKYSERNVITYRKGPLNIIIVDSEDRFRKWQAATLLATHLKCIEKADRIAIFETIIGVKPKQTKKSNPVWFDPDAMKRFIKEVKLDAGVQPNPDRLRDLGRRPDVIIMDDIQHEIMF